MDDGVLLSVVDNVDDDVELNVDDDVELNVLDSSLVTVVVWVEDIVDD